MIYLIHFDRPFKHARHYVGYVKDAHDFAKRIERHRSGNGAKLLRALNRAGIGYTVVRVWEDGTQNQERRIKNNGSAARCCPVCSPNNKRYETINPNGRNSKGETAP